MRRNTGTKNTRLYQILLVLQKITKLFSYPFIPLCTQIFSAELFKPEFAKFQIECVLAAVDILYLIPSALFRIKIHYKGPLILLIFIMIRLGIL